MGDLTQRDFVFPPNRMSIRFHAFFPLIDIPAPNKVIKVIEYTIRQSRVV